FLRSQNEPTLDRQLPKTSDVARLVNDRPAAWVDDDLDDEASNWAHTRPEPTLLIQPDPAAGLVAAHVTELLSFAAALATRS
ncbi:MAG: hypothetical protein HKN91_05765, partial [Acidimicrobiia bacterium]|nr:hypothetical protein [Acidimicrobiia bacterium]